MSPCYPWRVTARNSILQMLQKFIAEDNLWLPKPSIALDISVWDYSLLIIVFRVVLIG